MTMESDLFGVLKVLVSNRVYPDIAPLGAVEPHITWQGVGGQSLRFIDGTAADKRHTRMQINCWATTRAGVNLLARQIEDALCATALFTASPYSEPINDYDAETKTYGAMQDFSIHSTR